MFGAADNEAKAAEDNQLESASKKNRKVVVIMKTQKLNQVDLDNGSHSSEKTTNVNNATEVKVEAPTTSDVSKPKANEAVVTNESTKPKQQKHQLLMRNQ